MINLKTTTSTSHTTMSKINSIAYLSYKNRKEKGLINEENNGCPTFLFGDEWGF